MNKRLRDGKSSELIVAGELLRYGLDVYLPCVDDQAIDMLLRVESSGKIDYYDIQVKSVKGYNRIVGLRDIRIKATNYLLVIHYRHDLKQDEFFYLTKDQILHHYLEDSSWGDLVFNKAEREQYKMQSLANLAECLQGGEPVGQLEKIPMVAYEGI